MCAGWYIGQATGWVMQNLKEGKYVGRNKTENTFSHKGCAINEKNDSAVSADLKMTGWWLPDNQMTTACWGLLDECLPTAWRLPADCLKAAWQLAMLKAIQAWH
jgi:hypothetical protein